MLFIRKETGLGTVSGLVSKNNRSDCKTLLHEIRVYAKVSLMWQVLLILKFVSQLMVSFLLTNSWARSVITFYFVQRPSTNCCQSPKIMQKMRHIYHSLYKLYLILFENCNIFTVKSYNGILLKFVYRFI